LHEDYLLVRREFDHPPALFGPDRHKNLPPHSKIRVAHVSAFGRLGQAKGQAAEIVNSHGNQWRRQVDGEPGYCNGQGKPRRHQLVVELLGVPPATALQFQGSVQLGP
jgi:hypothetical protein